jgi:nicotinamidase-related amidase
MELHLDPKTTALVLIDLQQSIVGRPLLPHAPTDVVQRSARLAAALRGKGGAVVYVHVLVNEILPLAVDAPNPRPPGGYPASAVEIIPEAGMQPGDLLIAKRQWGAFYGTGLEQQLRRRGVKTIVLGGIATNIGVESTARAAFDMGYELVFAEDAMTTLSAEAHAFALTVTFPRMGRVRSTEQILAAFA